MKRMSYYAMAAMVAVLLLNCGDSETSPDPMTLDQTGGGGDELLAPVMFEDDTFSDGDWDAVLEIGGNGGMASAGHQSAGGNPGEYREVTTTLNAPSASVSSLVRFFSIKLDAVYDPSTEGAITSISYSEDSILTQGTGQGQASSLALRQGGTIYFAAVSFTTPDMGWTPHSQTGLTQDDFRTSASTTERPDLAGGGPIEFGFMRANSAPAGGSAPPGGISQVGGIDNWTVTVNR